MAHPVEELIDVMNEVSRSVITLMAHPVEELIDVMNGEVSKQASQYVSESAVASSTSSSRKEAVRGRKR